MARLFAAVLVASLADRALSTTGGASCRTALDCALNGDCVNSSCVCDAAWSGSPDCAIMAFDALDKSSMPGYFNETESSWGGFPVKSGSTFNLVHAQMKNGCPLSSWKQNSIVAISTSTSGKVEGPYSFKKTILPEFAHNPTIRQAADGTYVIFFIGGWATQAKNCKKSSNAEKPDFGGTKLAASDATCDGHVWPKSCGPNMPGPSNDTCGPADAPYSGNGGCGISMATSSKLDGPWEIKPLKIIDQWSSDEVYCAHTNPSPVFLPNGTVVLAFNAGYCHNNLETIGVAVADHYLGPYRLLARNAVLRNVDGTPHHCEDPFLWKSARGWHLLTHNQQGPQGVSSYGYSLDGLNWTLSPVTPYNCTVVYTDGTSAEASGCGNRPQVVFEGGTGPDSGPTPRWLINGATAAKPSGKGTWTLFRSIKSTKDNDHEDLPFTI